MLACACAFREMIEYTLRS